MKRGILAALVAAWLLPGQASAQDLPQGVYVEGRGGANFVQNIDVKDDPTGFVSAGGDIDIDTDTGWLALGAVGYASKIGWRIEGEGGFRSNNLDDIEIGGSSSSLDGDIDVATAMLNVFFDLNPSLLGAGNFPIVPFAGVGVGGAHADIDDSVGTSDDDAWAFAFQVMAGLSYIAGNNVTVSVGYTYLNSDQFDFGDTEFDYRAHSVLGGLRFTF